MIDMNQKDNEGLVSIIVPVYNCEKYIEKCLKSIINQSYKNIEILVVNDGSTDNSQKVINKIAQYDSRLRKLLQENKGVSAARNLALDCAKGQYYLFVDADDYIGENYVKDLVECANENQSELVISGYTLVYEGKNKNKVIMPGIYIRNKKEEWAYRISSTWGRLYSSEFWNGNNMHFITEEGAGGEDASITLYSNAMARNIKIINKTDYFYVQREGSAMNSKKRVIFLFPYVAIEEMYSKVRGMKTVNSREYFDMGVIKLLAMFKYVIYRRADISQKEKFREYVYRILGCDLKQIRDEWNRLKWCVDLPLTHKVAVSLFLIQMGNRNIFLNGKR